MCESSQETFVCFFFLLIIVKDSFGFIYNFLNKGTRGRKETRNDTTSMRFSILNMESASASKSMLHRMSSSARRIIISRFIYSKISAFSATNSLQGIV